MRVIPTHTPNEGPWESNINVRFRFMYSQKWNCAALLFPNILYELGTRPRSFISGNTSIGFSVQCILGYQVKHGVLSLQDIRRRVISSERGGGLLITLAIHLKQSEYFGNLCKKYLIVRMPLYHSYVKQLSIWRGTLSNLKVPKCEILMSWISMIFLSWSLYR